MHQPQSLRRDFLKQSSVATAAAAICLPASQASFANTSLNDRPRFTSIGIGGMRRGDAKGHRKFADMIAIDAPEAAKHVFLSKAADSDAARKPTRASAIAIAASRQMGCEDGENHGRQICGQILCSRTTPGIRNSSRLVLPPSSRCISCGSFVFVSLKVAS